MPAPSGLCNEAASPGTVTYRPTEDSQPFQCPAKASRRCGLSGPLQASPMSGCWQFNQEAVGAPRTILGCRGHLTSMSAPPPSSAVDQNPLPHASGVRGSRSPPTTKLVLRMGYHARREGRGRGQSQGHQFVYWASSETGQSSRGERSPLLGTLPGGLGLSL